MQTPDKDSRSSVISADAYKALITNLEMGVLIASDEAVYLDANDAACELYGRERAEIVGRTLYDFVGADRRGEVAIQWAAFLRDGHQDGMFPISAPDGSTRWLAFHAQAHFAPGLNVSFLTPATEPAAEVSTSEELVTVCAWTKDLRLKGKWVTLENYLALKDGVVVTHGVSPRAFAAFNQSLDARSSASRSHPPRSAAAE
ncbi:MAG: PAS domain-containing protein [Gemmatimonadota bacterium]